jgi:hypothetical protein
MAKRVRKKSPTSNLWRDFAGRHPKSPFLKCDPLYTLSEPIIDAVKRAVPQFFSEVQEAFERDLARTASFGFFHQQASGIPTARQAEDGERTWQERHAETDQRIHEMLISELQSVGVSGGEIQEYFQATAQHRDAIDARQAAYIGWLVTNGLFRRELEALRARWEGTVKALDVFPRTPMWPFFSEPRSDVDGQAKFGEECRAFYERWGLEQLLTWDWPVPMDPDLVGGMPPDLHRLTETGIVQFVPWYLLRGETVNLQDVVRQRRIGSAPDHLRDWVVGRAKGKDMGDVRYARLRWLYLTMNWP